MIDKKVRGNLEEKSPNAEGGTTLGRVHRGGAGQTPKAVECRGDQ